MKKIISGKVREVFEISDSELVIVTTDRISAFDVVLPKPVLNKGKVLNALSLFWFDRTQDIVPNHIFSSDLLDMPTYFHKEEYEERAILVRRLSIIPFECVVRGYVFGNMWEAYKSNQPFCGVNIQGDYRMAEKLNTPIFTPSTKAHVGHDEYISYDYMANAVGAELTARIRDISLELYDTCYRYAYDKGIIIADTKFEFGMDNEENLYLADEIFTPDSSRFWNLADYRVGVSPRSYDKQLVRDWLLNNKLEGEMQFDAVPDEVLLKTSDIYAQCRRRLLDV